jgi:hypothetical protein
VKGIMKFNMEVHQMRSTASYLNEQEEPNGHPPSESLEIIIANRARQISQRGDEDRELSLAGWLEAAREILSGDSERPC